MTDTSKEAIGDIIAKLYASDEASVLTNQAARMTQALAAERDESLERVRVLEGRLCVSCGRILPPDHDRTKSPDGCSSPDACTIDMTLRETLDQKTHLWDKERKTYEARIKVKDDALRPFAEKLANTLEGADFSGNSDVSIGIHIRHLRRAREALGE